jgi:gas vesicle protein
MAENNHSCVSGVMSAFFAGALLGAGLALLFTPVSGKEARQTIAHQYDELIEKIKDVEKKLHKSHSKSPFETTGDEEMEM